MTVKKETENLKTVKKTQAAPQKPSASSGSKKTVQRKTAAPKKRKKKKGALGFPIWDEVAIWGTLALCVILFISNFGIGGVVGNAISRFFFGVFGFMAYLFPVVFFLLVAFLTSNKENTLAWMKAAAVFLLVFCFCGVIELAVNKYDLTRNFLDFYEASAARKAGGGLVGGALCNLICPAFGLVGTYVILVVLMIICLVLITERPIFQGVRKKSRMVYENAKEDAALRRERAAIREEKQKILREESRKLKREQLKEEKSQLKNIPSELRRQRKVSGMALDNELDSRAMELEELHEIIPSLPKKKPDLPQGGLKILDFTIDGQELASSDSSGKKEGEIKLPFVTARMEEPELHEEEDFQTQDYVIREKRPSTFEERLRARGEEYTRQETWGLEEEPPYEESLKEPVFLKRTEPESVELEAILESEDEDAWIEEKAGLLESLPEEPAMAVKAPEPLEPLPSGEEKRAKNPKSSRAEQEKVQENVAQEIELVAKAVKPEYVFPPIELLNRPKNGKGGTSEKELRDTAMKLQQTLHNFGVEVHVTNVSCGPAVTRYELTPEQGVKVSRIVSLSDDIKLNLAAADIRIEAPIPGKAAVGIEVPNKSNSAVPLRELLETKEFRAHSSSLAFAAGKDIGGKVVVADIAKMPHLLIAGATGSGKSVCINTVIMSLLYKSKPEDVKLIMIDPKVVELSVYNGIPHLLIPVVTDPKKASGALNWAVAEMMDRYQKFADCNVRDLKGYNKKVDALEGIEDEEKPERMPQIVIIVDELADLMMVAPGEVEDAICRLAQLARAAGIHLIIATQRPSVNVITGLIKANMPSRIAFAVSSGVDSRTIIDMNGAEKLLGKGDMLFYPQGYQKPARVQGAFVSDQEVAKVVEFLTEKNTSADYSTDIEEKISLVQKSVGGDDSDGSQVDEYFEKAGRFIIEKDKASIGMLQRVLKVGFNRAARIMDQLAEAGVVGPEEGTKPRKVLMTMEQFEEYLSDYV